MFANKNRVLSLSPRTSRIGLGGGGDDDARLRPAALGDGSGGRGSVWRHLRYSLGASTGDRRIQCTQ